MLRPGMKSRLCAFKWSGWAVGEPAFLTRSRPWFGCAAWLAGVWFAALTATATGQELPESIRIATWNVEWYFDDFKANNRNDLARQQSAPSRDEYDWKKRQLARVISVLQPDIIGLQEVEDREVIFQLTKELESQFQSRYRYAYIDGFDFGTEQDVAILYKSGLVEYSRFETSGDAGDDERYYNIGKHLFCRFAWGKSDDRVELFVGNAHFRAGPDESELRIKQGRLMHEWVRPRLENGENVLLLGDFNTETFPESVNRKSDLGVLMGLETDARADDLVDLNQALPEGMRFSHMGGKMFDRLLGSQAMVDDTPRRKDLVFSRIVVRPDLVIVGNKDQDHRDRYYQIPRQERDISDHYPVMAEFLIR